jgi:hypothetical protein
VEGAGILKTIFHEILHENNANMATFDTRAREKQ